MRGINLLPWREELREKNKKEFFIQIAGAVVVAVLLIILIHTYLANQISDQQEANDYLNKEIKVVDKKIKDIALLKAQREKLLAHINLIQQLQTNRPKIVNVYNSLVRVMPPGVFVLAVERVKNRISILGKAESNTRISELMRNIERVGWLGKPLLTEIKTIDGNDDYTKAFTLMCVLPVSQLTDGVDEK